MMQRTQSLLWSVTSFLLLLACLPNALAAGDYATDPAAGDIIEQAVAEGVDREWAVNLLSQAQRQPSILEAMARPAEKTKPWHEYRQIFLNESRIRNGLAFAQTHATTLRSVAKETGVPAEVIVAIIGVETAYGRITGRHRVLDALATLAFDYPERAPFFRAELAHFLVLAWESGKDPLALQGSYAGAMGYGQFMPSSYRRYAMDFDGDGTADIWDNPADAILSVANYFRRHGWRAGSTVVVPAEANAPRDELFNKGLKPVTTIGEIAAAGLAPTVPLFTDELATPLHFDGENGDEYWLGLHNFYVITRYNHSAMYALAVWQLAEAIADVMAAS